jgi:hypothetical protein
VSVKIQRLMLERECCLEHEIVQKSRRFRKTPYFVEPYDAEPRPLKLLAFRIKQKCSEQQVVEKYVRSIKFEHRF